MRLSVLPWVRCINQTAVIQRWPVWLRMLLSMTLLCISGSAFAARQDFYFQRIDSRVGLAQNTVNGLFQDSAGFVWIATEGGLHRFDGYELLRFEHDPADEASLSGSFVTVLAQTPDGALWVGSNARYLTRIDTRSGAVKRFWQASETPPQGHVDRVTALLADGEKLWVGTGQGIERFSPETGERRRVFQFAGDARRDLRVGDFLREASGTVLAATDQGVLRLQPAGPDAWDVVPVSSTALSAVSLLEDPDGALVGMSDGLYRLVADGALTRIWPTGTPGPMVRDLVRDQRGRVWMALSNTGLARIDLRSGEVVEIRPDAALPSGLTDTRVSTLMLDQSGLLWVGTEARGVSTVNPDGAAFAMILDQSEVSDRVANNNARVFLEDSLGGIWIGTEGQGVKRYDRRQDRFEHLLDVLRAALPAEERARPLRVFGILEQSPGRLLISSELGLFQLLVNERTARRIDLPLADGDRLPVRDLRSMLKSRDGTVWIATFSAGLLEWSADLTRARWHRPQDGAMDSLSHPLVTDIFEDRVGRIWIGTLEGLNLLDRETGRIQRFLNVPNQVESLSTSFVRNVQADRDGGLWVGTAGGLNRIVESPDAPIRFERFGVEKGLPDAMAYSIEADEYGRLWVSSNSGIYSFDVRSHEIVQYGLSDGLQDLEFNGGASARLRDGALIFGGVRGVNVFNPDRLQRSVYQPPVQLTSVLLGREERRVRSLDLSTPLDVNLSDRVISFEFAALDFAHPEKNQYRYRLLDFDADWSRLDRQRRVTYTNLDEGEYVFEVLGTNHDGVLSSQFARLPVRVHAPWWWTLTVRRAYIAVGVGLLILLAWSRRQRYQHDLKLMRELQAREERLKLALWGSGDEFWDWDIRTNTLFRLGADALLGEGADAELSTHDFRHRAVHPDDMTALQKRLQDHIDGRTEFFESEHRVRRADGEYIWVRSRGKVVERDARGLPIRMAGTARDVSISRDAERERRVATEVLKSMGEAVAVCDLQLHFVSVNPAFLRMTGFDDSEVVGQACLLLQSQQHGETFYREMRQAIEKNGHWKGEVWQRRKDGEEFLAWVEIAEVRDPQGERTHYVWVLDDITDKKRAEQELRYLANYDTLTGLPNRALLSERLGRAIMRARRQGRRVAVLFLDLDRFKDINDSLGHAAGDRILKAAAARLLATVRAEDTVARLGGDEFTVVLEDLQDREFAEQVARNLLRAFSLPLDIDGRSETVITPSIGISLFPDHALVPTDLLKFADTAMYAAKERGRNTCQFYTEAMDAEARRRATLIAALRRAVDRREFRLVFQPRMSLADGRVCGFEALLRWQSEELGAVSPVEFIPVAEETGLILPIGEWVLNEAFAVLANWREAGRTELNMSINVSMLQLFRSRLSEQLQSLLTQYRMPPDRIELELTESMVMANPEQAATVLNALKALGLSLAIDDFGTGYSSLVYLKRLPIDTLKIDKEFVGDLTTDPDDEAITATIITMAHSLGLNVVAEGVETAEQLIYLNEQGCDEIQGYWLSMPLEEGLCLDFIDRSRPDLRPY